MGRSRSVAVRALGCVLVTLGTAGGPAVSLAHADVTWLCRPGMSADPCVGDLTTTVESMGAAPRVEKPAAVPAAPIDCFYVYPTVSQQPGYNADKTADDQVRAIALYQAQRFSPVCRVYAPLYRQETLNGLVLDSSAKQTSHYQEPYADLKEAFDSYLRTDNHGRGFVLIGHSQGAALLRALMRDRIDREAGLRKRLVSALLFGGNVTVARGSLRGGDFRHVPGCSRPGEHGCVTAWSSFMDRPSASAGFGRVGAVDQDGLGAPTGARYEVLCTDPNVLLGRPPGSALETLLPSAPFPGEIGVFLVQMFGGPPPSAATPWLQPADRYSARCEDDGGAHVLRVTPIGSARHLNASPTADFGLHLADINIGLGDLVDIVAAQSAGYRLASAVTGVSLLARPVGPGRTRVVARVSRTRAARHGVRVLLRRDGRIVARRTVNRTARFTVTRSGTYEASAAAVGATGAPRVASAPLKVQVRRRTLGRRDRRAGRPHPAD